MGITAFLIHYFTLIISATGYPGIALLMALESMVAPVPSEAVMPFTGFLLYEHKMALIGIIIASTLGSIIGSLISYYIGMYGGRAIVRKWGKFLLLNEHHLDLTEKFFSRYGDKTIFFSRFIPVVRHFISIPAGVGEMKVWKFTVYTAVGAAIWNSFLMYVGYYLGSNWESIRKYSEIIDMVIVAMIVAAVVYFFVRRRKAVLPPENPS